MLGAVTASPTLTRFDGKIARLQAACTAGLSSAGGADEAKCAASASVISALAHYNGQRTSSSITRIGMRYLTYSELIFINGRVLNDSAIQAGRQKVRDIDLLLAAEQRPSASAFGQDAYPSLAHKAGALLHSLARNHPFRDGNKRTATVGVLFMMEINGEQPVWNAQDALGLILRLAAGQADVGDFAAWVRTTPVAPAPAADVERDTAHIDRLLRDHQWLLDELARQ